MFKKLLLLAAVAVTPAIAEAQVSNPTCSQMAVEYGAFFSNATADCWGFYLGNENRGGAPTGNALTAITQLGGSVANVNLNQVTTLSSGTIDLTGLGLGSIVGIHWGGGNQNFKDEFGNGSGYGTAFFKVTSITGTQLTLNSGWRGAFSNAASYGTVPTSVPEPASFGLVAAGLLGLGAVARRRRQA